MDEAAGAEPVDEPGGTARMIRVHVGDDDVADARALQFAGQHAVPGLVAVLRAHPGIDDHAVAALHRADDVHDLGLVGLRPAFVHDRQIDLQPLGEGPGALGAAGIGRDDHHLA